MRTNGYVLAEMNGVPRPDPQEVSAAEVFEAPGSLAMRGENVPKINVEPA